MHYYFKDGLIIFMNLSLWALFKRNN